MPLPTFMKPLADATFMAPALPNSAFKILQTLRKKTEQKETCRCTLHKTLRSGLEDHGKQT